MEATSAHWDQMNFNTFLFLKLWSDDDINMIKMKLFGINAIIKHIKLTILISGVGFMTL